ncbi:MAG TPA: hypothetical protein DCZ03_11230 [Gammaproteobacteria bacterium]|nr:hypothetical protein [Gammaproteobacteria bacterium]
MNRRNFIQVVSAGTLFGLLGVKNSSASEDQFGAGSFYYTEKSPGRWHQKVAGHIPHFEVSGESLKIVTGHEMNGYEHYIVKHQLFDQNFNLIAEKMFDPVRDKAAVSIHPLSGLSGKIYAVSVCNKHDNWVNSLNLT